MGRNDRKKNKEKGLWRCKKTKKKGVKENGMEEKERRNLKKQRKKDGI